jgi:nitrogen fixation/metabolism regulation signal transduction histidine kinase
MGAEAQLRKLREKIVDRESLDAVGGVAGALQHGREILEHLGAGGQFGSPNLRTERIHDLLQSALDIARASADEVGVAITVAEDRDQPLFVEADRNQLIRVFTNLVKNAIQASARGAGGEIAIAVSRRGSGIQIRIADRGVGLSDEQIERAFEPGFSSKGEGKGGLGLAISYLMVDAHGGYLDLERNADGRGIAATVWLPENRHGRDFAEFRGKKLIVASRRSEKIRQVIEELEERQSCQVAEAHEEAEILALIREDAGWDVILLDDSMPVAAIESLVGSLVQVRALSV